MIPTIIFHAIMLRQKLQPTINAALLSWHSIFGVTQEHPSSCNFVDDDDGAT